MNPDIRNAVAYLEDKRDLFAAQPPSQSRDVILRALDELIAEYRVAPA